MHVWSLTLTECNISNISLASIARRLRIIAAYILLKHTNTQSKAPPFTSRELYLPFLDTLTWCLLKTCFNFCEFFSMSIVWFSATSTVPEETISAGLDYIHWPSSIISSLVHAFLSCISCLLLYLLHSSPAHSTHCSTFYTTFLQRLPMSYLLHPSPAHAACFRNPPLFLLLPAVIPFALLIWTYCRPTLWIASQHIIQ